MIKTLLGVSFLFHGFALMINEEAVNEIPIYQFRTCSSLQMIYLFLAFIKNSIC